MIEFWSSVYPANAGQMMHNEQSRSGERFVRRLVGRHCDVSQDLSEPDYSSTLGTASDSPTLSALLGAECRRVPHVALVAAAHRSTSVQSARAAIEGIQMDGVLQSGFQRLLWF